MANESASEKPSVSRIRLGCLGTIAFWLILWAFFFGITWNGKHHEIGCSCDRGANLDVAGAIICHDMVCWKSKSASSIADGIKARRKAMVGKNLSFWEPALCALAIVLSGCAIDTSAPDVEPTDAGVEAGPPSVYGAVIPGSSPCYPVWTSDAGVTAWYCPAPKLCGIECVEKRPEPAMQPDPSLIQ